MDYLTSLRSWVSRRLAPAAPSKGLSAEAASAILPVDASTAALQSAAVWACVRLISQSLSALPAHVFEETADGKRKAVNHPLYRLLSKQPNALMTFSQWTQTTVLHLLLHGNAFTLPQEVDGEIFALWPLDPSRVRIMLDSNGSYYYRWFDNAGRAQDFDPTRLLHFRIFSLDGIIGLAPLDFHRLTFESEAAAHLYAATLWKNGGRPSGVLEYPGQLNEAQVTAIRNSWRTLHSGAMNASEVAVLYAGTKYTPVSVPLQQLEYIASQKFSVEQIARIFGVPPHMIGAADQPTYASVEQQSLEFSSYTQQPILAGLEQTIETRLLEPPFLYRYNLSAFARADLTTRYKAYSTARQWGWFSVNDIRELEEMNRIPEGDIYLTPLNMAPASDDPAMTFAPPQKTTAGS